MTVTKRVQAAYDQIFAEYDERNGGSMPAALVPFAEQLVWHAGRGGHVVEIGCGTGRDMAWFEQHALTVTGVDVSTGMLTFARSKVSGQLLAMDMSRLGFRDASFDAAWCCASLLHVPKERAAMALTEIHRVLKVGGLLVVSVQEGHGECWEEDYGPDVGRFFARYSHAELHKLLNSHDFCVDELVVSQGNGCRWLTCAGIAE